VATSSFLAGASPLVVVCPFGDNTATLIGILHGRAPSQYLHYQYCLAIFGQAKKRRHVAGAEQQR
jgi:hypothetical protein